jgi:hypothetical protein
VSYYRPLTGDEKRDAKAGGMHLRLFRRGASDGSQTPFRWTRTTLPDVSPFAPTLLDELPSDRCGVIEQRAS